MTGGPAATHHAPGCAATAGVTWPGFGFRSQRVRPLLERLVELLEGEPLGAGSVGEAGERHQGREPDLGCTAERGAGGRAIRRSGTRWARRWRTAGTPPTSPVTAASRRVSAIVSCEAGHVGSGRPRGDETRLPGAPVPGAPVLGALVPDSPMPDALAPDGQDFRPAGRGRRCGRSPSRPPRESRPPPGSPPPGRRRPSGNPAGRSRRSAACGRRRSRRAARWC